MIELVINSFFFAMFCCLLIVMVENVVNNYVESKSSDVESFVELKSYMVKAFIDVKPNDVEAFVNLKPSLVGSVDVKHSLVGFGVSKLCDNEVDIVP
jgi:hypothetical protein